MKTAASDARKRSGLKAHQKKELKIYTVDEGGGVGESIRRIRTGAFGGRSSLFGNRNGRSLVLRSGPENLSGLKVCTGVSIHERHISIVETYDFGAGVNRLR